MELIGLFLNFFILIGVVCGSHHDHISLTPSTSEIVRFTNDSHIVYCNIPTDHKVHWKSPKGEIVKERKGRVHIEERTPEKFALIFEHISPSDKGEWSCEEVEGPARKSFKLIVNQKISFMDNDTMLIVKEGKNATIRCEVKGDPEPTVSWYLNDQPISFTNSKFKKLGDGLLIHHVTQNDAGEYTCKAFQISAEMTDVQEHTVLLKIEHKPIWTHKHHLSKQYGYIGGTASITCEAMAEPPANFTWYRNKKRLNHDKHMIKSEPYSSTLHIQIKNTSVFDLYKCKATNNLGGIERSTELEEGTKPPQPSTLSLRGKNSNRFDVVVGSERPAVPKSIMDVNGFCIEYMTDYEFKSVGGNWTYAKQIHFPFEDGATFLINNLEPNTTYFVRAASKNLAGLSDYTRVVRFTTLSNEPPSGSITATPFNLLQTLILAFSLPFISQLCTSSFASRQLPHKSNSNFH